jgi:hypothetical protein
MKNRIILGLTVIVALFSCRKENDGIGLDTNRGSIEGVKTDTFSIQTSVQLPDSNWVSSNRSTQFVGALNCDATGLLKSSTYLTFTPNAITEGLTNDAAFDSITISFQISDLVGQGETLQLKTRLLSEIVQSEDYIISDSIGTTSLIGTHLFNNLSVEQTIYLKLDSTLGAQIFADLAANFQSANDFQNLFPGVVIGLDGDLGNSYGSLIGFAPDEVSLNIHYTDNNTQKVATAILSSNAASFANIQSDITGSDLENLLLDSALTQNSFPVQGLGGPAASVYFPTLLQWYESGNYIITKAELVCPVDQNYLEFGPLDAMSFYRKGTASADGATAEYSSDSLSYTFNISTLVRNQLEGLQNEVFQLGALNPYFRPGISVLNGPSNLSPMKLVLFYTEY